MIQPRPEIRALQNLRDNAGGRGSRSVSLTGHGLDRNRSRSCWSLDSRPGARRRMIQCQCRLQPLLWQLERWTRRAPGVNLKIQVNNPSLKFSIYLHVRRKEPQIGHVTVTVPFRKVCEHGPTCSVLEFAPCLNSALIVLL
jgi:hypothetical protein